MSDCERSEQSPPQTDNPSPWSTLYSVFDKRQKALIVLIISIAATFSGFASNIYFPALPTIGKDLNVSIELVNLTVTSYLIFQGLAPSLWGPISDVKGRRIAYIGTFIVFFSACIGLALTKDYAALIILRCLQSTGSASTIAIGSGVIGDITTRADRGGFMGIFQAGLLVPVAVGPVIGGALAGSLGWRAIFWFLAIYSGIFLFFLFTLLPETLRSLVGNGGRLPSAPVARFPLNIYQRTTTTKWSATSSPSPTIRNHIDILSPLRILLSKQAAPLIFFLAIYYAVWQMSITAMSTLFSSHYNLSQTQIGYTFVANGVGSMIGTLITGRVLDAEYKRAQRSPNTHASTENGEIRNNSKKSERKDGIDLERARLRLIPLFAIIQSLSLLTFAWTLEYPHRIPLAIPIISTFVTGWTAVSIQSIVTTYLVDVFDTRSAAAGAALNLARCLIAALGTGLVESMIRGVGVGGGFSIAVGMQVVGLVGWWVQWKWGGRWRREARDKNSNDCDGGAPAGGGEGTEK